MTKHDVKFVSVSNFSIEQEGIVDLTMCNSISGQLGPTLKICLFAVYRPRKLEVGRSVGFLFFFLIVEVGRSVGFFFFLNF